MFYDNQLESLSCCLIIFYSARPDEPDVIEAGVDELLGASTMKLVEWEKPRIEYCVFTCELGNEGDELDAVILQFSGAYPHGSAGASEAAYMQAIRDYALNSLCYAVVFDLRGLDYEWGNNIFDLFQCDDDDLPKATVVSDRCRQGLSTWPGASPLFDDLDSACDYLRSKARKYEQKLKD